MLRWIRRKVVEIVAEAFHASRENEVPGTSLQNKLDDYADHQIAGLLWATTEYRKAKKDPNAFVEKYFSEKIEPIKPFVDSWTNKFPNRWFDGPVEIDTEPNKTNSSPISPEPEEEWFDDPEAY